MTSCATVPSIPILPGRLPTVEVDFELQEAAAPGRYQLTGKANFPNNTELNLLALRILQPTDKQSENRLTYSILDYQVVEIVDGEWTGELDLWQLSDSGTWHETWQLDQSELELAVEPSDDVIFLATFTPLDQLTTLEGILAQQGLQLETTLLRTTPEGRRYLQMGQVISLEPPTDALTASRPKPHNGGWGRRYLLIEEPPMPYQVEFPDERQTNRPVLPEEFLY